MNWNPLDFLVMGLLLLGAGGLFWAISRKTPRRYHWMVGVLVVGLFLFVWAELAVGVFTDWGS